MLASARPSSTPAKHVPSRTWFREAKKDAEMVAAPVLLVAEVAAELGRGLGDPDLADYAVSILLARRWSSCSL
jgi:hypothetical protein